MLAIQYDLFEENSEFCLLKKEFEEVRKSSDSVRRGLFAKHNELMKIVLKQQEEIESLKRIIKKT